MLAPSTAYFKLNPVKPTAAPAVSTTPANPFGTSTQPTVPNPVSPTDYYKNLLSNDTLLNNTLGSLSASGVADQAALRAGQQKAVVQFGKVPSAVLSDPTVSSAIDQTTRDLAQQNTSAGLSTAAKLKAAYDQQQQATDADLAARGMLRSGEYGQRAAQNLLGYQQSEDTATSQLLDYLSGLYNGYLAQQQALQDKAYQANNDALNRVIAGIAAGQYTYPTSYANPAAYTVQQLADAGAPSAGASPFSPQDTTTLAHFFGNMTPQQLQQLGVGTAASTPPPTSSSTAAPSRGGTKRVAG